MEELTSPDDARVASSRAGAPNRWRGAWARQVSPALARIARADGAFAASHAQARLWRDYQMRCEQGATQAIYHSLLPIRFHGTLDIQALARTLEGVLARHESLRTSIVLHDGELLQRPLPPSPIAVVPQALECLGDQSRKQALRHRMDHFVARTFDLQRDPLLRAELWRVSEHEHVLLVIAHHLASDGWSMDLLYDEVVRGYQAEALGTGPAFEPLTHQYADFAGWEAAAGKQPDFDNALAYWLDQLGDAPRVLNLPTDRPRPARMSWRGACQELVLPPDVAEAVRTYASDRSGTSVQLHLAVMALVLARWAGQRELVVGTPSANRPLPELEGMIGVFSNLLPLRLLVDEDSGFDALLGQVRDRLLDALEHQQVPYDALAARVGGSQGGHAPPFLQALLIHSRDRESFEIRPGQDWAEALPYQFKRAVHTDLTFHVRESGGGTGIAVFYATELFDAPTIERLLQRYVRVLADVVRSPAQPLRLLQALSAEEATRLAAFEQGEPTSPGPSIAERFLAVAASQAGRPALVSGERTLTYAELARAASQVASALHQLGEGGEPLVAVCLPRDCERIVAILGTLLAARAFMPIDPACPPQRLSYLLQDSGVRTVIGNAATLTNFDSLPPTHRLDIDHLLRDEAPHEVPSLVPSRGAHGHRLAYVIYTSGSTGQPKGVEVTQAGIANFVAWYGRATGLGPADRCVQLASPNFDASLLDTLPALCLGASLCIGADAWRQDPDRLWQRLADAEATVAFLTTPLFNAAAAASVEVPPTSLRSVQVGGDRLQWPARPLPFDLHDLYGPTEITIATTAGRVEAGRRADIGGPIDGMVVRVLDDRLRRVPIGAVGELCVSGPGLARGYRGRPGMTAARFLADPYAAVPGARLYRTGDRVRWTPEGHIEYLGRSDHQVKILGHRVELCEVEAALLGDPDVAEALVATHVRPDDTLGLTAYVRLAAAGDAGLLRERLSMHLPVWMMPSRIVPLDRFPLTLNGKVDRDALLAAAPDSSAPEPRSRRPPEGPVAELVAAIWSELLDVPTLGADDDFFALGGHSLLVGRLQSRIASQAGCEIPFSLVFDHPVLAAFATAVEDRILTLFART